MYITNDEVYHAVEHEFEGVTYRFKPSDSYEDYAEFFHCPVPTFYKMVKRLGWDKSMFNSAYNRAVFANLLNKYAGVDKVAKDACFYKNRFSIAEKDFEIVLKDMELEKIKLQVERERADELQTTLNRAMGEIQRLSDKLNERAAFAEPSDSAKELKFWKDYAWHLHQSYSNYLIMNTEKDAYEVVTQLEDFEHEFDGHRTFL